MKLIDILKQVLREINTPEDDNPKNRVLGILDFRNKRTLTGTEEDRLIKKIIKDVSAIDGEELGQYLKSNLLDRKNSWKARMLYADLFKSFEGKK